jgi:hypothetical protein
MDNSNLIRRANQAYAPLLNVIDNYMKGKYLPVPLDDENPKTLRQEHRLLFYGCIDQWEAMRGALERALAANTVFLIAEDEQQMIEALHEDMERYNDLYDEGQERFEAALSSLDRSYDYHNSILYGLEYLDNLPDALAQVIKTHRPQLVEICESVLKQVDVLQQKLKSFLNTVRDTIT